MKDVRPGIACRHHQRGTESLVLPEDDRVFLLAGLSISKIANSFPLLTTMDVTNHLGEIPSLEGNLQAIILPCEGG